MALVEPSEKLPAYVYKQNIKGRIYYRYCRRRGGPTVRLDGEPGSPQFEASYRAAIGFKPLAGALQTRIANYAVEAMTRAKHRAAEYGYAYDLTQQFIADLIKDQDYRCAVSGIAFDLMRSESAQRKIRFPFRPSIDRLTPSLGYVQGNVRIVCFAVNMAISDWGDEIFLEICRATVKNRASA